LKLTLFICLVTATDVIAEVLTPAEEQNLNNAVDLTAGFFDGFGKSNISKSIEKALHEIEGDYKPASHAACGSEDISNLLNQVVDLYETVYKTGCLTTSKQKPFCPTVWHPEKSVKWLNDKGVMKDLHSMIGEITDYFKQCTLPKIEKSLEAEALKALKEVSDYIPYFLEIKEATDMISMIKQFHKLTDDYSDFKHGKANYYNIGKSVGIIAKDIVLMSEGKSIWFGFISANNMSVPTGYSMPPTDDTTPQNEKYYSYYYDGSSSPLSGDTETVEIEGDV
jgi:hypothetical protein